MMGTYSLAGDYASLRTETADFYYGYEVVADDGEEWCFLADVRGKKVKIPYSQLTGKPSSQFDCGECLLAGIGMILDRFKLEASE